MQFLGPMKYVIFKYAPRTHACNIRVLPITSSRVLSKMQVALQRDDELDVKCLLLLLIPIICTFQLSSWHLSLVNGQLI